MAFRVRFLEVGIGEVRGVLQRVEVLVAEQFLDVPEVRALRINSVVQRRRKVCGVTATGSARRSPCRRTRFKSVC